jgi:hypothetical protein
MSAPAAWHLAQINIATLSAPRGDSRVAPFFAALDAINALAEASPGFVWRFLGAADTPDPLLVANLSLWSDVDALFAFVYRSGHAPVMARRADWFVRAEGAHQALWWLPAGTVPSVADGFGRLWMLDRFGPSPQAFTFKARFAAPGPTKSSQEMPSGPARAAHG